MASIAAQLETYRSIHAEASARGDEATARKIAQQIQQLEEYQQRHPESSEAPSAYDVYCDLNPSDPKCLVYDD